MEARDTDKHPTMHRTTPPHPPHMPPNEELPGPQMSTVLTTEKPWVRGGEHRRMGCLKAHWFTQSIFPLIPDHGTEWLEDC